MNLLGFEIPSAWVAWVMLAAWVGALEVIHRIGEAMQR